MVAARWILILAVIVFASYYFARQWSGVQTALQAISPLSMVASFVVQILGLFCGTLAWVSLLNGLGPKVPVVRGAQIALVGGLGKYVPGSLWAYVLQMELGRAHGIVRGRVLVASLYAAGVGVVSSLVLGGLAMPTVMAGHRELLWLFLLLPVGLACLHPKVMTWLATLILRVFKRPPLPYTVSFTTVLRAFLLTLLSYALYGLHLWFLVNALVDPNARILMLLTGAISLGFTIGLFAFVLPSGIGAREAILIGAMTLVLNQSAASAVSLVSRAMFVASDLVVAGAAALAAVVVRRRLMPADASEIETNYPEDLRSTP
jgi:uncharacterized membrane protein YbhN (UPF0104 family)